MAQMKRQLWKPSPKMLDVSQRTHLGVHRILEGAVRSAKSFVANSVAIREIGQLPPCNILVSGYSIASIGRNVKAEWQSLIDPYGRGLIREIHEEKDNYVVIDWRGLKGKKFYFRGAGKENDYKQIQGATFGYWYADEWARHCENFTDMAFTRLTPSYAKSLLTTNPDSPFHYVKTRFIDDEERYKDGRWMRWQFWIEDNPSLTDEKIAELKGLFTGVFYKRYILGLWCLAEGAIYDFFEDKPPYVKPLSDLPKAQSYVVGVDYGTSNPTAFLLFGQNPIKLPYIWCEDEYYYDSKVHQKQKTDHEYAYDFFNWLDNKQVSCVIIDPSAASFKAALKDQAAKRGKVLFFRDADNDVITGIRTQARMLKHGEYAIAQHCKHTIAEYPAYSWDDKAQLKGIDAPSKAHDHCKDAERYVLHTLHAKPLVNYRSLTTL